MQHTGFSRHRRVRRRFAMGGGGLAVVVAAVVALALPAAADTIQFTGQGTNADGSCETFEGQPPAPGGTQTWQFNLTQTQAGATMSATFSDGTTVTDKAEDDHNGNTSMWFIVTDAGATLISASATFTPSGDNSQFVVSHCTAGGTKPPPPTTPTTPTTEPAAPQAPSAPVPVTAAANFTG
jgi:hypothetical protein